MPDFITLSCPSCGGHLRLDSNTQTYTCDYCGQQHRVRNEDIEFYGKCPICKRNDRVEKVSAIFYKKEALSQRLSPPDKPESLKKTHYESEPFFNEKENGPAFYFGFLFLIFLIIALFGSIIAKSTIFIIIISLGIGFSVYLIIKGKMARPLLKAKHEQKLLEISQRNLKLRNNWELDNEEFLSPYYGAMNRYELLYYCHRDDVVFIPGEGNAIPPSKLKELCYKGASE